MAAEGRKTKPKKVTFHEESQGKSVMITEDDDTDADKVCERINKMLLSHAEENFEFPDLTNTLESDSDEYDIDLDEIPEDLKETTAFVMNCGQVYLKACSDLNVIPASIFKRQYNTSSINLKHYGISDNGAIAVARALKSNQTVQELNLHDNGLGAEGVEAICGMMTVNLCISSLDISSNSLGKSGMAAVARMIQNSPRLKKLDISHCKIQGIGVKDVICSLSNNRCLQELNLSYNEISDSGAACFEKVLLRNTTLKSLDISFNNISFVGMETLYNGLTETETLEELSLAWNGLGDNGAALIGIVLSNNTSIKVLDISYNHLSPVGIEHVADSLGDNSTLKVLKIGGNPFLTHGAELLLDALLQETSKSSLKELVLDGIAFNKECENKLSVLRSIQPNFVCKWDGSIRGGAVIESEIALPLDLYLTTIYSQGFRLLDFYRYLSQDGGSLTREDFIVGSRKRHFPFGEKELGKLFDFLDTNNKGSINYDEFLIIRNDFQQTRKKEKRKSVVGDPQLLKRFVET